MPERERVAGVDIGRPPGWYYLRVCVDCGDEAYRQYKQPFAERCKECHKKHYAGNLGQLTIPIEERSRFRREE